MTGSWSSRFWEMARFHFCFSILKLAEKAVPYEPDGEAKLRRIIHVADVGGPEGSGFDDPEEAILAGVVIEELRYGLLKVLRERGRVKWQVNCVGHEGIRLEPKSG